MLQSEAKVIGLILTSITFALTIFAMIISSAVLIALIYQWYHNRIKQDDKIAIYLCIHIYLCMLLVAAITLSMNMRTLLGDLTGQSFDSLWCIFSGYLVLIHISAMYMAFVNQAFYRLIRIVYPRYRCFQSLKFYTALFITEYLCANGIQCAIIAWDGVIYLIDDHFCYVSFTNLRAVIWAGSFVYLLPCLFTTMVYSRITIFLRNQTNTLILAIRQRQGRDFSIVRRILMMIIFLIALGIPAMFFILRFVITGNYYPLTARIIWLSVATSTAGLNVASVYCIPQVKSTIRKVFQQHRVIVANAAI
ncbi:unnamed protein product [Adineta ricciae]|uniref:G-protein coupled receptors family 1 profile domain-containing protein n=1 Tax=Adineta ricciae TaxID=249248 RepID=A0A815QMU6_ADIRI|nr:unnamed protein product [Adineta ricciae]CAF1613563.1 unnamed protein product [Adineta ricciae]